LFKKYHTELGLSIVKDKHILHKYCFEDLKAENSYPINYKLDCNSS